MKYMIVECTAIGLKTASPVATIDTQPLELGQQNPYYMQGPNPDGPTPLSVLFRRVLSRYYTLMIALNFQMDSCMSGVLEADNAIQFADLLTISGENHLEQEIAKLKAR